jgi:hypothetical protein
MPALVADIQAGTREASTVEWTSAAIAQRYPFARDGASEPGEGFFDSAADAQAVLNARGALIGTERWRFAVEVDQEVWPDLTAGVPQLRLIDAEQGVDGLTLASRIELDLENERTIYELFGAGN